MKGEGGRWKDIVNVKVGVALCAKIKIKIRGMRKGEEN